MFSEAGFDVYFATETGEQPACDERMLGGVTGTFLGANKKAKDAYQSLTQTSSFQHPLSWTSSSFTLDDYDLVFLPGGHEKGVRQIIDSEKVHQLLAAYFPQTKRPSKKALAAICHGVQILASASHSDGKSLIQDVQTTALPHAMEQGIFQATRLFLGDYYKTYGAGTPSVLEIVTKALEKPSQFKNSLSPSPYVTRSS